MNKQMTLPTDPAERKGTPITTGVLDYFPLALAEVARVSKAGNDQHNPGQPLHWAKDKSTDHADCIARHLIDRGTRDTDGQRHSAKLVWRALANLETELQEEAAEVVLTKADIWNSMPEPVLYEGTGFSPGSARLPVSSAPPARGLIDGLISYGVVRDDGKATLYPDHWELSA